MPEHKAAGWTTPIWDDYKKIVNAAESREVAFVEVERFAVGPSSWHLLRSKYPELALLPQFYELAKKSYCVVSTGEQALYANVSGAM